MYVCMYVCIHVCMSGKLSVVISRTCQVDTHRLDMQRVGELCMVLLAAAACGGQG